MNFTCGRGTFLRLSVRQQDLLSTFERSRNVPLTFRATVGPSVPFSQLFVRSWVFPSTFVNFPCVRGTLCQLSAQPRIFRQLSLHPHNLRQLPSTFRGSTGPSINFRQLSVHRQYLPSTSVNFLCIHGIFYKQTEAAEPSVNIS